MHINPGPANEYFFVNYYHSAVLCAVFEHDFDVRIDLISNRYFRKFVCLLCPLWLAKPLGRLRSNVQDLLT